MPRNPAISSISECPASVQACTAFRPAPRICRPPHLEDEIYFVLEGKARLRVAEQEQEVGPGSILYVQATADHSFFDIEEDLTLLAFFGPIGATYV